MQYNKTSKFLIFWAVVAVLLALPCLVSAASLTEGFEGTFPPSGWTVINNDGGTYTWTQYTYPHTGTYAAGCHYESSESDDWMITPQLTSVGANDVLSFWYRVYSASYTESLEVRLSTTTDDMSSFTTVLWAEDNIGNLTYLEKKINLGAYVGEDIYIAFVYKSTDKFYLYVDDVSVYEPAAHDYAVNQFIDLPGSFEADVTYDIKAEVENKGGDESACDVKFFVDGGEQATLDVPLVAGEKDTVSFSWTPSLKSSGVSKVSDFDLEIQSFLTDDADPTNDSVLTTATVYPAGYTTESFEDATFPPEGWAMGPGTTDWARYTSYPHTGSACARARGQNAWLFTPRLDVGTGDVLKYWYRSESASYATSFYVRLSTSASQEDTSAYTTILADHPNITSTTYMEGSIDLSPYAGKGQIYIAFHRYYGYYDYYYLFLDDVTMPPIYVPPGDMATISIDNPSDGAALQGNSAVSVQATVQNVGGDPQDNVAVHLEIDDGGGYTYTDIEYTGTLNQDDTEQITFDPDWTVPNTNAGYTVKVWTALAGDGAPDNDTLTIGVSSVLEGYSLESFENTTFPPSGWIAHDFDGGGGWLRSTTYSHTGDASAKCSYDVPNDDWLITPPLKIQAGVDDVFKFWIRTASTSSYYEDYMVRLSTATTDTSDFTTILLTETQIQYPDFVEKELDLDAYDGQTVYIAFHLISNDELGLYIDDVLLPPIPTQIAVSPDDIYEESFPDSFFDVFMYIENVGGSQLNYSIELESAVGWLSVDPTSGSALGGEEDEITLSFNTTGLDGHYYNTISVISNSGEKQDDGDTVEVPVHIWVRAIPGMAVSPDSFAVEVPADGTEDDEMFITNTGGGPLDYEIETEEWGKLSSVYAGEPANRKHGEAFKSLIEKEPEKDMEDSRHGIPPTKGMGGPDTYGYRWIDSDESGGPTFNWVEINGVGTLVDLGDDQNLGPFPIGFTFNFYGNDFDQFRVCSNGFVSFTSTSTSLTNYAIPTASVPNDLLALFWDDLNPSSTGAGDVYYYNDGTRLIIEYDHVIRYGHTECPYTMEIFLYPNGKIIYQYLEMGLGACDYLDDATIGIENADGTDGLEVVYNALYVHDNLAIKFSAAPSWLVFDPESGTVPVGETGTVDVTFDATGILGGEFFGAFLISGNDPDNPLDTVPAHMTILSPDMTVSPDSIVSNGTEGATHHEIVNLGNGGTGDLNWSIDEDVDWLAASPSSGTVPAGGGPTAVDLTVDCTSLYAGDYYGELTINNNDPDLYPSITYKVYLHVGPDPAITVTPDEFYVEVYAGSFKDSTMNIANSGAGHLVFDITTEETEPPKDIILTEGFEDAFPPAGWDTIMGASSPGDNPAHWTQDCSGAYSHTGSCGALCPWGYDLDEWLISPTLSVGNGAYVEFWWESSYYWHVDPYDNGDLFLKVSTNGGSSWQTLWTFGEEDDVVNSGGVWPWENFIMYQAHVDLSGLKGNILIAFHIVASDNADIAIDDVVVEGGIGGGWLIVSPESGVVNPSDDADVTVTFNATDILGGEKFGNIIIDHNVPEPKGQTLVPVHMVILGPEYSVDPESLVVVALEGQPNNDYDLYIGNLGGLAPLTFELSDDVAWLDEIPSSGSVAIDDQEDVTVRVDGTQLIPGDYYAEIYVETNDYDETFDTVKVYVHVGPDPEIRVKPEAFLVEMFPGTTKDSIMTIVNDGDGTLAWELTVEDVTPLTAPDWDGTQSEADDPLVDQSTPASLTRNAGGSTPEGSPIVVRGDDTLFVQLPHSPDDSWSFITTDVGAGYKGYENFWSLTGPITDIDFWGLCLWHDGVNWNAGDPGNLVFDITFYSDPAGDPSLPPTEVLCTYTDVIPTTIVGTGQYFAGFEMYFFDGPEFDTHCDLTEGWVSIQSKSTGTGDDWLLWASALTGDGFSYHEGGTNPRSYDQAMILTGGGAGNWLTVSPESGQTPPLDSTDVDVTFDATELPGGTWFANIIIDHNAPDKGQTIVPVRLSLLGPSFSLNPESLVVNVNEGEILDEHLYIGNFGGEGDLLFSMTDPMDWLAEFPDAGAVSPDQDEDVLVRVDATGLFAGHYYTEITILTNDFDFDEVIVPVHVNVGPDPDIDVASSFAAGVIPGCQYTVPLRMDNLGGGHLEFDISIMGVPPMKSVIPPGEEGDRIREEILKGNMEDPSKTATASSAQLSPDLSRSQSGSAGAGTFPTKERDLILAEDFESGVVPPSGWTSVVNNPFTWEADTYAPYEGSYYATCYYDENYTGTQDEWLISPSMDLSSSANAHVSFWWNMSYYWAVDPYDNYDLELWISTDGGANFSTKLWDESEQGVFTNWVWYGEDIDLTSYVGNSDVKLGWRYYGYDGAQASVDYIIVEGDPLPCPFTVDPASGVLDPESFIYLGLTFDGDAFAECTEDVLTCYLKISSNDPDEPVMGVEVNMYPGRGDVAVPFCLIELADPVFLINFVLKGGPAPDPLCMGDCDPLHDGMVDMSDIVYLLQYLYQGGVPPAVAPETYQPTIIKQNLQKAPAVPKRMEHK